MRKVKLLIIGALIVNSFPVYSANISIDEFDRIASACAPDTHVTTLRAIAKTESDFNPFAIGVQRGRVDQPNNLEDALKTVEQLEKEGKKFALGISQIFVDNLKKMNISYESAFDVCSSVKIGSDILSDCFIRAKGENEQDRLQKSFSCYYSGNFTTGFKEDISGQPPYVQRVINSALKNEGKKPVVPEIDTQAPVKAMLASNQNTQSQEPKETPRKAVSPNPAAWDVFSEW